VHIVLGRERVRKSAHRSWERKSEKECSSFLGERKREKECSSFLGVGRAGGNKMGRPGAGGERAGKQAVPGYLEYGHLPSEKHAVLFSILESQCIVVTAQQRRDELGEITHDDIRVDPPPV
jgi:hypothetical protein